MCASFFDGNDLIYCITVCITYVAKNLHLYLTLNLMNGMIAWHRMTQNIGNIQTQETTLRKEGSVMSVCQMISASGHSTPPGPPVLGAVCKDLRSQAAYVFWATNQASEPRLMGWMLMCWWLPSNMTGPGLFTSHCSPYNPHVFCMYVSDCAKVSVVGSSYNLIACGINHLMNNPAIACWSRRTTWLGQKKTCRKGPH